MIIPYRFRSIIDADLPMVERWLKTPEVARWWGDPAEQLVLLKEDLAHPFSVKTSVSSEKQPKRSTVTFTEPGSFISPEVDCTCMMAAVVFWGPAE